MKHGRNCIALSGVILIILGITCIITCMSAQNLISSTWEKSCAAIADLSGCINLRELCENACDKEAENNQVAGMTDAQLQSIKDQCKADCAEIPDEPYSEDQCQIDLKREAECVCPENAKDPDECDCSGAAINEVENLWKTLCMALGAVGLVGCTLLTGIPAIISAYKKVKCCNVYFYSVFCGIFTWIFMAGGGGFIAIGMAFKVGPVKDFLDDCENEITAGMDTDTGTTGDVQQAVDDSVDCGAKAFCDGIRTLSNDAYNAAMSIGIPFFLAGLVMFFGMYACCCCKKSLPGNDDKVEPAAAVVVKAEPAEPVQASPAQ